jgi:hypothetical protein
VRMKRRLCWCLCLISTPLRQVRIHSNDPNVRDVRSSRAIERTIVFFELAFFVLFCFFFFFFAVNYLILWRRPQRSHRQSDRSGTHSVAALQSSAPCVRARIPQRRYFFFFFCFVVTLHGGVFTICIGRATARSSRRPSPSAARQSCCPSFAATRGSCSDSPQRRTRAARPRSLTTCVLLMVRGLFAVPAKDAECFQPL